MSNRTVKKAPVGPKSANRPAAAEIEFRDVPGAGRQAAAIFMGVVAFVFALHAGEYILAPIAMGVVVGLMLGPLASRLERRGLPPGLSALVVVLFISVLFCFFALVAAPLSVWADRLPQIWQQLQSQLSQFKEPLEVDRAAREELRKHRRRLQASPSRSTTARRRERRHAGAGLHRPDPDLPGQPVFLRRDAASDAGGNPQAVLHRRLRWRVAHIFRDVEALVSRYLLSITRHQRFRGHGGRLPASMLVGVPSAICGARWRRSPTSSSSSAR